VEVGRHCGRARSGESTAGSCSGCVDATTQSLFRRIRFRRSRYILFPSQRRPPRAISAHNRTSGDVPDCEPWASSVRCVLGCCHQPRRWHGRGHRAMGGWTDRLMGRADIGGVRAAWMISAHVERGEAPVLIAARGLSLPSTCSRIRAIQCPPSTSACPRLSSPLLHARKTEPQQQKTAGKKTTAETTAQRRSTDGHTDAAALGLPREEARLLPLDDMHDW
jgi:hypothetical protein